MWAGVDVGGRRKGFHAAVVAEHTLLALHHSRSADEIAAWLQSYAPRIVAVDSPITTAGDHESSRACERQLVAAGICNLRYTPARDEVNRNDYYDWIRNGFLLYAALAEVGLPAVECFPTASWSRLAGQRGKQQRREWSRAALDALDLSGVPPRLSQDEVDAIGAAVTARLHDEGRTEMFGEIAVPSLR